MAKMNPERWQQIDALLQEALEKPAQEFAAMLDQSCASDESLRQDVESLIKYRKLSENFLEVPVLEAAAELLLAEGTGLADDQINFPTSCQVNHVEQRLPPVGFYSRIQVRVLIAGRETLDESTQLRQSCFDHEIDVLG